MKIVVAGLAKSGTTGLYYKIKNSLPGTTSCHFECHLAPKDPGTRYDHTLAKIIYKADSEQSASFASYDKKIVILRDPRDRLVSAVLYASGAHCNYSNDPAKVESVASLLRRKEAGGCISLLEVMNVHRACSGRPPVNTEGRFGDLGLLEVGIAEDLSDYFVFRYDDLIRAEFCELEAYLGVPLSGAAEVDSEHQRVVRTKNSGSWRHWFTEEDVRFFRPLLEPVVESQGWDRSWQLAREPSIYPDQGSEYFMRLVVETGGRESELRKLKESPDFKAEKKRVLDKLMGPEWAEKRKRSGTS